MIDADDLVDAAEVARLLGLSSRNAISVYRARYPDFPVPAIERGTCVLWSQSDIESWMNQRPRRRRSPAS